MSSVGAAYACMETSPYSYSAFIAVSSFLLDLATNLWLVLVTASGSEPAKEEVASRAKGNRLAEDVQEGVSRQPLDLQQ